MLSSLPDPALVDQQQFQQTGRSLLDRLQSDTNAKIIAQMRKRTLAQQGEQQKIQHAQKVDCDLQREAIAIEQRGNSQLMMLQQAAMAQTLALEQEALSLKARYQMQAAGEDRLQRDFAPQRPLFDGERRTAQGAVVQPVWNGQSFQFSPQNPLRATNSFDEYLGNPRGRPKPPPLPRSASVSSSEGEQ